MAPKVGGQVQKYLPLPLLKLLSLELESFKKGQRKFFCLNWPFKNPKYLQTLKFYKNSQQTFIKEKPWKEKDQAWRHTSSCCVYVSLASYKKKTQKYICKNFKENIRVSNIPFSKNQAWNRDFKPSFVFSSLKTHFLIQTCCKVKWTLL